MDPFKLAANLITQFLEFTLSDSTTVLALLEFKPWVCNTAVLYWMLKPNALLNNAMLVRLNTALNVINQILVNHFRKQIIYMFRITHKCSFFLLTTIIRRISLWIRLWSFQLFDEYFPEYWTLSYSRWNIHSYIVLEYFVAIFIKLQYSTWFTWRMESNSKFLVYSSLICIPLILF